MKFIFILLANLYCSLIFAQQKDSVVMSGKNYITLAPIVLDNKLNVPAFISRIKNDSSFYKAFRNLHIIEFTAINDIRMLRKDGSLRASLNSRTRQLRDQGCRTMQVLNQAATGDIFDSDSNFNYYTANMYASLFFTNGRVCGEDNIVAGHEFSTAGKRGMEKHKEQLKMLFFNPGRRISIPFMGKKTEIFDEDLSDAYDMSIDMDDYNHTSCYILRQKVKPGMEDRVVIDEMNTWFNDSTYEVVARNYILSYDAGVYDFKVNMEVIMTTWHGLTVPAVIRYNGNWKAIFKKRERGVFTATLSDFR